MNTAPGPALTADLAARESAALLPTYTRRPVAFVEGRGTRLIDIEGRRYLDFLSGLSVTALGHAHPAVAEAVSDQARRLVHVSNLFYTVSQIELAERLQATLGWPDGKAFLCSSGAEANEAALKLARRHGKLQHPDKVDVVALAGGFHGRTLGALAATGNPAKREPFQPLGRWVTHVPFDDPGALDAAVDERTCAVLLEVVQGEAGVRPVPDAVLHAARAACDRAGALLIVDEVQTGLGRLGAWYGWQTTGGRTGGGRWAGADGGDGRGGSHQPVMPDIVCIAKALANGLPIGAMVAHGPAATVFGPGDHATTFGGGPVVCAAALAVLGTIEHEGLVQRAATAGAAMARRLRQLVDAHDLAGGVRGRGLLQALVLSHPVGSAVVGAALERGLIVNDVAPDAIRLAPALIVDDRDLEEMTTLLDQALADVGRGARG